METGQQGRVLLAMVFAPDLGDLYSLEDTDNSSFSIFCVSSEVRDSGNCEEL